MHEKTRLAIQAVKLAAKLTSAVQIELAGSHVSKGDKSPVTIADFGAQALVGFFLSEAEPGFAMVAEEDAAFLAHPDQKNMLEKVRHYVANLLEIKVDCDMVLQWIDAGKDVDKSSGFWTLDPVDGTKGFVRGDQYAIALAWIENGQAEYAALGCPNLPVDFEGVDHVGTLYFAQKDTGSWMISINGEASDAIPITVSENRDSTQYRLCESFEKAHSKHGITSEYKNRLGVVAQPVRIDSQAKYAMVARGDAEVYLRAPTRKDYVEKIWDHAAGSLVLSEAGGIVTDIRGKTLVFDESGRLHGFEGILASHGSGHDFLLQELNVLL